MCYNPQRMIRKKQSAIFRSFYRDVIPASFKTAWFERWMWPWAIFASAIVSGGLFDVAANIFQSVRGTGSLLFTPAIFQTVEGWVRDYAAAPNSAYFIVNIAITVLLVVGVFLLSCLAQGVLVYGHGGRAAGKDSLAKTAVRSASTHLWQIVGLTFITGFFAWIIRFALLVPYVLSQRTPSVVLTLVSIGGALVYLALTVLLIATHIFALNAIVQQGARLAESLVRAWTMARQEWLHLIELGFALWLINALALSAAALGFVVMGVPIFLVMVAAALLNNPTVLYAAYLFGGALFIGIMFVTAAITVSFQYGVWHHLYLRLGEGGLAPKIHRLVRWFMKKA